jgi:hypothetical protein
MSVPGLLIYDISTLLFSCSKDDKPATIASGNAALWPVMREQATENLIR